jgi:fructosamine-3-kinase
VDKAAKDHIEYLLCVSIENVRPISGGDISQAYLLETDSERFFCKINTAPNAPALFQAEKLGLEALAGTHTIYTPKVFFCDALEEGAVLVMEYIAARDPNDMDMLALGHQLAMLHTTSSAERFGSFPDNFIGSLPQSNASHERWVDFFIQERLLPQLKMARDTQRLSRAEVPSEAKLIKVCENLLPDYSPSLLHGDLWGGNYLIAKDGVPVLIDPASYYGHSEMDLAMTQLFGGFSTDFYRAYHEVLPKAKGTEVRLQLYQLYYMLAHLNLFGKAYYSQVKTTLNRYF